MTEPEGYNPPLRVVRLIATRMTDTERGPMIWMRGDDAAHRMLVDGELVWVYGPRRHELATLRIDDSLPRGDVVLRDIAGASPSEVVRVIKPDLDTRRRGMLA
jgi:anaerobic selenocysteine-containing dehydrogenase